MSDLQQHLRQMGEIRLADRLRSLETEIDDARLFAVVVGQFSRGKSSLINALLGIDYLPIDVIPTTAHIHIVRHRVGPSMFRTVDQLGNGSAWLPIANLSKLTIEAQKNRSPSVEASSNPTQSQPAQDSHLAWIEVGLEHPLLAQGLVLVDTPGTDDLNTLRAEVVYSLIPRADILLMVLSAKSQLHKSEQEFLKEKLLQTVTPPIIFPLNMMDLYPDPEDRQDVIDQARQGLTKVLPKSEPQLIPVSAKDQQVEALQQTLQSLLKSGVHNKNARAVRLLGHFSKAVEQEKHLSLQTLSLSVQQCESVRERLHQTIRTFDEKWPEFEQWIQKQGVERLFPLLHQSLEQHIHELHEDIKMQMAGLRELGVFGQDQLPRIIEKSMRAWLDRHLGEIKVFSQRFVQAVTEEYEFHFGRKVQLKNLYSDNASLPQVLREGIRIEGEDSDNLVRIGYPAVGALVAGVALSGGFAALGLVAGHLFAHHQQKENQKLRKEEFLEELPILLQRVKVDYGAQIEEKLQTFERRLIQSLQKNREEAQNEQENKIQELIGQTQDGLHRQQNKKDQWDKVLKELERKVQKHLSLALV